MTNLTKFFIALGCLFILVAVALRVTWIPVVISKRPINLISLLGLANTCFILAVLFKK